MTEDGSSGQRPEDTDRWTTGRPRSLTASISRRIGHRTHMPDDTVPVESNRAGAQQGPENADDRRAVADRARDSAEENRATAESAREQAERLRAFAEEARALREQYREELELVRNEREALRHAAEETRQAAEGARHATIEAVAATADSLCVSLAQMQFLEEARNTFERFKPKKGDIQ